MKMPEAPLIFASHEEWRAWLAAHHATEKEAWLLHYKILRAMADREEAYLLRGKIQIDDSYLGGELPGGKAGRGSAWG